jgi:hypothetical protein
MEHGSVVGQSSASKNVSTEAKGIVVMHHQATNAEDTAEWEDFVMCCSELQCGNKR